MILKSRKRRSSRDRKDAGPFGTDSIAKSVAATIAALYVIGLLITNIHLSRFGLSEFAVVRVRYVWVGLDYLIYLAAPFVLIAFPLAAFSLLKSAKRARWAASAFIAFAVFVLVGQAFQYFVHSSPGVSLESPMQFWRLYFVPHSSSYWEWFFLPTIMLLMMMSRLAKWSRVPLFTFLHRWITGLIPSDRFQALLLMLLVPCGAIGTILVYTVQVYPNIEFAVGGGQPQVVSIRESSTGDAGIPFVRDTGALVVVPTGYVGPYILWHQDQDAVFISPLDSSSASWNITAVRREKIVALRFHHVDLYFEQPTIWGKDGTIQPY